ncbi:MAG: class I SAM-dependent methyltransferase [Actinomycetota bacterium]
MDIGNLRARVGALQWYHTLELAPGLVTPGWFDTRPLVRRLPFPSSLKGKRCLDVGTFDGFWAFEMERRGAAEVVAIDVLDPEEWDWPVASQAKVKEEIGRRKAMGAGFEVAREALRSNVRRIERSVHDLKRSVDGTFDFVYVGSLLLHLRDPVGGLMSVRDVCAGEMLLVDAVDVGLSTAFRHRPVAGLDGLGRPWWWKPNLAALVRMVEAAGFLLVRPPGRCFIPAGRGQPRRRPTWRRLRSRAGREAFFSSMLGNPHAVILARPKGWTAPRSQGPHRVEHRPPRT